MSTTFDDTSVGITSTIPVEIVFASGARPVDLNNRFITHENRWMLVEKAEAAGFPLNFCAWIKGIYALAAGSGLKRIIGVSEGDCSNTHLLMEILEDEGIEVMPFSFPRDRSAKRLAASMEELAEQLGTTMDAAETVRRDMEGLRGKLERIDELTWREWKVSGFENHLWLINSSDMRGDWRKYEEEVDEFLAEAEARPAREGGYRLGFVGIPPIVDDLYEVLDGFGAQVVYNEFQRQFSMPGRHEGLVEQYLAYTYPYQTSLRIADITSETKRRGLDGLVHYVQSFCFRQLQDRMIRRAAGVPVLAVEFDRPGQVDGRSLTRVEAFVELLEGRRRPKTKGI